jgi:hypothetical protein
MMVTAATAVEAAINHIDRRNTDRPISLAKRVHRVS